MHDEISKGLIQCFSTITDMIEVGLPFSGEVVSMEGTVPLRAVGACIESSRYPMLLDSGPPTVQSADWDYLVFDPVEVIDDDDGNAFERLDQALERHFPDRCSEDSTTDPALPPFRGGAVGWLGYDLGRQIEQLPVRAQQDVEMPDLLLGVYPCVLAHHRSTGRRVVVGQGEPALVNSFVNEVRRAMSVAQAIPEHHPPAKKMSSTFTRSSFMEAVKKVREHILDGDIYQVNLAQRFEFEGEWDPVVLHAALRRRFPAPYGAVMRTPDLSIISTSPELFLRRRGEDLLSCPIKGTRPRGETREEDLRLQAELESSPKEMAELAMIVDLVRNDLGKTATVGSVKVQEPFATERWSTVFHRVGSVQARYAPASGNARLLKGMFPPASVTGTPKIRAQEIIEELEPVRRHLYTGALGWFGANGDMELSVAIRVATCVGHRLLVPVGGGITLGSEPDAEYEETLHKARPFFEVLGLGPQEEGAP